MAIVRKFIRFDTPLTPEQIQELEEMEKAPIVYDEDCPKRSYEELVEMYEKSKEWRADRKRKREEKAKEMQSLEPLSLSLEVLPSTARVAKKYGEVFIGRLLDLAANDEALMKKCL